MSKPHHVAVLLLGLVPAGVSLAPNEAATEPLGDVGCKIRAMPAPGGVRLEGVAMAKAPVSGTYELVVKTTGGGSNTVRTGEFASRAGGDISLGEVLLNIASGVFYTAVLKLEWAGAARA